MVCLYYIHPLSHASPTACLTHLPLLPPLFRYERVVEGQERIVVIVNAGQQYWQRNEYGVWVGGGGTFSEIFCSQVRPTGNVSHPTGCGVCGA
jgi:hypothetical protein